MGTGNNLNIYIQETTTREVVFEIGHVICDGVNSNESSVLPYASKIEY
jgi:hypothetical protein